MEIFQEQRLPNGIILRMQPTDKFKMISIELFIHQNLERDAAMLALIPPVLLRGTEQFPEKQAIERELDALYGAELRRNLLKKGERHLLSLRLEIANPKYLATDEPVLARGLELLSQIVLKPRLEKDGFTASYVEQEKNNLAQQIASIVNDKRSYALKRCAEEMCRDENYRYYQYGEPEVLEGIDARSLYAYYRRVLAANPMDIYIVGDIEPEETAALVEKLFAYPRANNAVLRPTEVRRHPARSETVVERLPVNQGKLAIGYRTGSTMGDDSYASLLVGNSILGGGGTSKLFVNVREKASLAYYASSQIEVNKGLMFISAGIEPQNFAQAVEIIDRQVTALGQGEITADELRFSKRLLTQSLQKNADAPAGIVGFHLANRISGRPRSLAELIAAVEAVTVDEVAGVGREIRKDTTYFLQNEEGSESEDAETN